MFAVIALSKTCNVEPDHLIHRYAVPLPLRREGLNAPESGRDLQYPAQHIPFRDGSRIGERGVAICGERSVAARMCAR